MINYPVATVANTLVGTLSPNVAATIATNLQASGGGVVAMQSATASFKLTGWTTVAYDATRFYNPVTLTIFANLGTSGSSGAKLVATLFNAAGSQIAQQTFTSTQNAVTFYQANFGNIQPLSDPNWTLQLSLTNYITPVSIDQVYLQFLSAGAVRDLSPISTTRAGAWTTSGGRDTLSLNTPGSTRSGRLSYQYPTTVFNIGDTLVSTFFIIDQLVNWANHPFGQPKLTPYIFHQQWPLNATIANNPSNWLDMNMVNGAPAVYSPSSAIATPFTWGDMGYGWTGNALNGGWPPDLTKLTNGTISAGIEAQMDTLTAGFNPITYSIGGQGSASPCKLRIFYDPVAVPASASGMFTEA